MLCEVCQTGIYDAISQFWGYGLLLKIICNPSNVAGVLLQSVFGPGLKLKRGWDKDGMTAGGTKGALTRPGAYQVRWLLKL